MTTHFARCSGWLKPLYFLLLLAIFASLTSQQRNYDGPLQDIALVTMGRADSASRHPLYTLVGVPLYRAWVCFGWQGDAGVPLMILNAVSAALGCTLLLLVFQRIFRQFAIALPLSLTYAFSYGHWYFTQDAFYNVFTYVPAFAALLLLLVMATSRRWYLHNVSILSLAGLLSVAILGTQEHILFAVMVSGGLLMVPQQIQMAARLKVIAKYGLFLSIFTGSAYVLLATQLSGCRDAGCIIRWLRPYDELLPMYSQFSPDRFPAAAWSFLSAIVPLWRGMSLRKLQQGIITPDKLIPQLSLVLTVFVLVTAATALIIHRQQVWREFRYPFQLALIWFFIYAPPVIWLDPYGPERWIIPLIPVLILVGIAASVSISEMSFRWRYRIAVMAGITISAVFTANLTQAILPDHRIPNPDIAMAKYASEQMTIEDIVISPRWDWTAYLESYGRTAISLPGFAIEAVGRQPDAEILLQSLEERITKARDRGGRAFLVDLSRYSEDEWEWITRNIGLRPEDFERFSLESGWQLEDQMVWLIK